MVHTSSITLASMMGLGQLDFEFVLDALRHIEQLFHDLLYAPISTIVSGVL